MLVNNQGLIDSLKVTDKPVSFVKPGDVTNVVIKERLSNNEAVVLAKGQDMKVQFDGGIPSNDRVMVEVGQNNSDDIPVVKPVSMSPSQSNTAGSINDLMIKSGFDPSANGELKQAADLVAANGGSVTKATLNTLQGFLTSETGSVEQKLETIQVMQLKKIPLSQAQLHDVHTVLHGEKLGGSLVSILNSAGISIDFTGDAYKRTETADAKPSEDIRKLLSQLQSSKDSAGPEFKQTIERLISALKSKHPDAALIEKIRNSFTRVTQINHASSSKIEQALNVLEEQGLDSRKIRELLNSNADRNQLLVKVRTDIQSKLKLSDAFLQSITQNFADGKKLKEIGTASLNQLVEEVQKGNPAPEEVIVFSIDEKPADSDFLSIKSLMKQVQKEPSFKVILDAVGNFLSESDTDFDSLNKAYAKAVTLSERGRELAARKELSAALAALEKDYPSLDKQSEVSLTDADQYLINESIQSLKLESQNVMVSQITKKLSQMTIDFKKMRQDITRNLDQVSKIIETNKPANVASAKQTLESVIKKLDQTLLKSDVMLYADMSTEKKMLTASSKLAQARELLSKGSFTEANGIVKEVKSTVEKLMFKPSDVRMKHFVSEQSMLLNEIHPIKLLSQQIEHAVKPFPGQDPTAREVFETVKKLGLTHEIDAASALVAGTADSAKEQNNVKATLLKVLQDHQSSGGASSLLEQTAASLTGQQLLNKNDSSGLQQLYMQLPLLLDKQIENVKVFVNSQSNGEKVDWENCTLHFVLETKKLGEVGIQLSAQNRSLSLTFNSNLVDFQEKMEPLTHRSLERLKEIGYSTGNVHFSRKESQEPDIEQSLKTGNTFSYPKTTDKGFDFSI